MASETGLDRREILPILRTTPDQVARISSTPPPVGLATRPAEGEWSIAEVLAHLVLEEEKVMLPRFRRIMNEDSPLFGSTRGRVDDPSPAEFSADLAAFRRSRAETLAILDGLDDAGWARTGVSPTRGPLTTEGWARYLAQHDLEHLQQIESIRAALDR